MDLTYKSVSEHVKTHSKPKKEKDTSDTSLNPILSFTDLNKEN